MKNSGHYTQHEHYMRHGHFMQHERKMTLAKDPGARGMTRWQTAGVLLLPQITWT